MTWQPTRATIKFENWPDHWGPQPVLDRIVVVNLCDNAKHHDMHIFNTMAAYPEEKPDWVFCRGVTAETTSHIGRSFGSMRHLEDGCPCPKEPCGLVDRAKVVAECQQHPVGRMKTIRQSHEAKDCPGNREGDDS